MRNLKILNGIYEYGALKEGPVKDRIVCRIRDERVKDRLLREDGIDLIKAIDIWRAAEYTDEYLKVLKENDIVNIETIKKKEVRDRLAITPRKTCSRCGRHHSPIFLAIEKRFHFCHKNNHFSKVCKTKHVNTLEHIRRY